MDALWWSAAIVIMALGLIGTVLPVVPGTTIIVVGAVLHRVMVGPEKRKGWFGLAAVRRQLESRRNLDSTPNTGFRIDLYADTAADPNGSGEGRIYLGTALTSRNSTGDATTL